MWQRSTQTTTVWGNCERISSLTRYRVRVIRTDLLWQQVVRSEEEDTHRSMQANILSLRPLQLTRIGARRWVHILIIERSLRERRDHHQGLNWKVQANSTLILPLLRATFTRSECLSFRRGRNATECESFTDPHQYGILTNSSVTITINRVRALWSRERAGNSISQTFSASLEETALSKSKRF